MSISFYPLRDLRLSPLNVRKAKPSAIEALAADIAAHGLLQNLIGYEEDGKVRICAGGRRYRALKLLAKGKQIDLGFTVPVDVRPIEEAIELSLAENSQREAMHPADAIVAYRALIEGGLEAESIAARFGVSLDHVRRILKLAALHPKLIAALRKDELSLGAAQALALSDDLERQLAVFRQAGDSAHRIRALLTESKVSVGSALVQFVGLTEYRSAGGTVTTDLFASEDEGYADDVALLQELAMAKLEQMAEDKRSTGWGKVEIGLTQPDNFYSLNRLYPDGQRELTVQEQAELEKTAADIEALEAEGCDPWDERIRTLESRQRQIEQGLRFYSDEQKASATLYLLLSYHGLEELAVGPMRQVKRDSETATKPDYPAALQADLGTIRTLAVREALAGNPALALDVLLDTMLGQLLGDAYSFEQALDIKLECALVEAKPELREQSTITPIEDRFTDLLAAMQVEDRMEVLAGMSLEQKLELLAFCTASQITSSDATGSKGEAIDAIGRRAGVDMARCWQASASFFARLSKPVMFKLLAEHCGEATAENCAKLKKADLAAVCAERLAETDYLPPVLQLGCDKQPASEPELAEAA